jgi:hypothetical protein
MVEMKRGNYEVIPQAMWPIVKSHKEGWMKGTNSCSWSLGLNYQPLEKATTTADCLENQITLHDLCDENLLWLDARVQALHEAADGSPLENVRPHDVQKLIKSLKLRKTCGIDNTQAHSRRPLGHLTHLFNHCLRLSHFPKFWKDAKINLTETQ